MLKLMDKEIFSILNSNLFLSQPMSKCYHVVHLKDRINLIKAQLKIIPGLEKSTRLLVFTSASDCMASEILKFLVKIIFSHICQ